MKCQKCGRPAVVHLTEIVTEIGPGGGEVKRNVEIHLCLEHAVAAGLLTPLTSPGGTPPAGAIEKLSIQSLSQNSGQSDVPAAPQNPPAQPTERAHPAETESCPVCGMTWNQFKQHGLMGCGHDYDHFSAKLLPLLKRAQEGATEHVGKVPLQKKTPDADRQVTTLRLRRELQKAVEAENYEAAAQLRDKLRKLEQN
jgi:protein arginine kinase activator